jgi:putative PIN family toxin of toxin-antitoxin system
LEVVLSRYILDELSRILPRLNYRLNWQETDFADFIDVLALTTDLVDPSPANDQRLRDEADRPVLGTLLAAQADYLVTGDRDLLALAEHYPILTPAAFWERHGG